MTEKPKKTMLKNPKLLTAYARRLRREQTDAERVLWRHLRDRQVNECKFRRQYPLGSFIVGLCCVERRLVVELDGGQHAEQMERDARRTAYLNKVGYRVVRYWDHDVLTDPKAVVEDILRELEELPHPTPLPSGRGNAGRRETPSPSPLPQGEGPERSCDSSASFPSPTGRGLG